MGINNGVSRIASTRSIAYRRQRRGQVARERCVVRKSLQPRLAKAALARGNYGGPARRAKRGNRREELAPPARVRWDSKKIAMKFKTNASVFERAAVTSENRGHRNREKPKFSLIMMETETAHKLHSSFAGNDFGIGKPRD